MPAHRNREDAAIEMLQHPETFPSLPERHAANRELCLWRLPAFEPHSSWSIWRLRSRASPDLSSATRAFRRQDVERCEVLARIRAAKAQATELESPSRRTVAEILKRNELARARRRP